MNTTETKKLELSVEFDNVTELWVRSDKIDQVLRWKQDYEFLRDEGAQQAPRKIEQVLTDDPGDNFYIFWVADCFDPPMYLVCSDSFEDAFQDFINFAAEHCHLKIDDCEYADYGIDQKDDMGKLIDNCTCNWTSEMVPVDTESIMGHEVRLVRVVQK